MSSIGRELRNTFLIVRWELSAGMGLHGFLRSSNFIDGGVTGVSMLLEKTTGLPLSIMLPLVNLPFIALAWKHLGRAFAIRSTGAIGGLAIALATLHYPDVTPDLLLTAVFGGFFIGAGIGLAVELRGAGRHRNRRSHHQQTQSDPEGWRHHSDIQHRFVSDCAARTGDSSRTLIRS